MFKFLPEVCYTKNSAQTYQTLSRVGGIRVQDYKPLALVGTCVYDVMSYGIIILMTSRRAKNGYVI